MRFFSISGQHGHISNGLHPAHAHLHSSWYAGSVNALGSTSSLQGSFASSNSINNTGVPTHSQSYHLGLGSMVCKCILF